jgi:hypothetical protein
MAAQSIMWRIACGKRKHVVGQVGFGSPARFQTVDYKHCVQCRLLFTRTPRRADVIEEILSMARNEPATTNSSERTIVINV